jgi:endonuclease YncB( thermonuclease family)
MPFFLLLAALVFGASDAAAQCTASPQTMTATVARVIDAETLGLHDGTQVRLAGVLTPQAQDAGAATAAWPAAVAAKAEVEAVVLGKSVMLAPAAEARDRYGRHVAHVSRIDGTPQWLQGHLLAQGLARVMMQGGARGGMTACEVEMLRLEAAARQAGLGLWKEAAYRLLEAADVGSLTALAGTYQVIEGAVATARRAGPNVRLEFAEKARFGLGALVPARGRKADDALAGRRVRLHGWIEERGGRPFVDLTAIGSLETLSDASTETQRDSSGQR